MNAKIYNETTATLFKNCEFVFNKSKIAADDCRTNKAYTNDGVQACSCWSKAVIGVTEAKKYNCKATDTSKQVKAAKNKCVAAFSICKKAEDAAVALIHTCMAGDVKNISATGRVVF